MDKKIKVKCKGAKVISWKKLVPFQDDLVFSTEDELNILKNRIIKKGFDNPINVWENEEQFFTLDGHRRRLVFEMLEKEGWKIPNIPINYVYADNEADAKERILGFRSQFGHVTQDGFDAFIANLEIDPTLIEIDNIEFALDIDPADIEPSTIDEQGSFDIEKEYIECPSCGEKIFLKDNRKEIEGKSIKEITEDFVLKKLLKSGGKLLKAEDKVNWSKENPANGYSYLVSEALYHYIKEPLSIRMVDLGNISHWYLVYKNQIIDFTKSQYNGKQIPYNEAKAMKFTKGNTKTERGGISKNGFLMAQLLELTE